MPKYRVYAKAVNYYYQDVEANNVNEAMELAKDRKANFEMDYENSAINKSDLEICMASNIDKE